MRNIDIRKYKVDLREQCKKRRKELDKEQQIFQYQIILKMQFHTLSTLNCILLVLPRVKC
jgi:hypothetical protein